MTPRRGFVGWLAGLQAPYDTQALRPPQVAEDETARLQMHANTVRVLLQWCHHGALPRTVAPLTVAALRGTVGTQQQALLAWGDAFGREIDGGIRLDAMGSRGAGLKWRLQAKLNDSRPWRDRHPDDPWDCGWASSAPPMLTALRHHWMPRRPTLVLADATDHVALRLALAALWQRRGQMRHPVRWIWVGGGTELPAAPGQSVTAFTVGPLAPVR